MAGPGGAVEFAPLDRVDRFNHRRPREPIGGMPPAQAEERCWAGIVHAAPAA